MNGYQLLPDAEHRIGEIYAYTRERWGPGQADRYYHGLFDKFEAIVTRALPWRAIPAEFGVDGYFCRFERHFIYWRMLGDGRVGVMTILHERMHQAAALREAVND